MVWVMDKAQESDKTYYETNILETKNFFSFYWRNNCSRLKCNLQNSPNRRLLAFNYIKPITNQQAIFLVYAMRERNG